MNNTKSTTQPKTPSFFGVTYIAKRKRWSARITFNGTRYFLGTFKTREEACEVYAHAYSIGGAGTRAWVNRDPAYRGSFVDAPRPDSEYLEIEKRLKTFSFFVDADPID